MTREEAYEYWRFKYEMAKDFDDPRWEGGEIREIRRYVDALATIVKMLEPPATNADRIRARTDEGLARFIANQRGRYCDYKDPSEEEYPKVLEWLKSPVEVDDGT